MSSTDQLRLYESNQQVRYSNEWGTLYAGDSISWLESMPSNSVDLIVADPPYNINKADWDSFESQEHYIEWSMRWISEASRVLTENGSMYVCGFSEILADLKHPSMRYFSSCRWLIWHYKNKANLGKDWGRAHESVLHLRKAKFAGINTDDVRIPYGAHTLKYPGHPQAETSQYGSGAKRDQWVPNPKGAKPKDVLEIPTTSNGMKEKTPHPTQKPEELVRKLVLAASRSHDIVLDPFSGSGTTAVVAQQLGRRWLACDLSSEYNEWAVDRLQAIQPRSVPEWIELDRKNLERRSKIR